MALILTFLGKGGTGRTTIAIAAAQQLSSLGQRVLLIGQDPTPTFELLLGLPTSPEPQEIAPHLQVVKLRTTMLLERNWEEIKKLEAQSLRSPTLKNVFGQELGILPGMDNALALNALREYDKSGKYDAIVYDGRGDQSTLRMLGMPEILSWYQRRFQQVFEESDIGRLIGPFIQPITSSILNVALTSENLAEQEATKQATQLLEEGRAAVSNPNRVAAYLVTTDDPGAIATAKYLWGGAQQIGLTVGGTLLNQSSLSEAVTTAFAPLPISPIPTKTNNDWQPLKDALPDFKQASLAPKPMTIDIPNRQVRLFLPGFDKNQVKLTQSGPEVTIEAGDQRHNILLPPPLNGESVKGAKFQDSYLTISF